VTKRHLATALFTLSVLSSTAQPRSITFKPTVYYNNFSPKYAPVLSIRPADTIKTESVDAGGIDKNGVRLAKSGNPVTGPFYIEGAQPGDVVAVTFTNVSLNRNYATSVEGLVKRTMSMKKIKNVHGRNAKMVKWTLNIQNGIATPDFENEHLKDFKVPLRPFLGCVGVAARSESKASLTYFADEYGGNMDFYKITKGATVYLPVFHEGALLYLGDGHAGQGDGEINGDALETSMDFTFVTRVIKGNWKIEFPFVEDDTHIIAMAMDKTIEQALKSANLALFEWLQLNYQLTLGEATHVIGHLIEYRIPTLAGPKLEVAAMIKKEHLSGLIRKPAVSRQ
jgi:amidase